MHLTGLLHDQDCVVSRRQLMACGLADHDVRRLVRRRELSAIHPGVYLGHTGTPTWLQSAWAAVLACDTAALAGQSALRAFEGPGSRREQQLHVVIPWERRSRGLSGVRVERRRHFEELVMMSAHPPRVRFEEAVLDVADAATSDLAALDEISRAVQGRRTTARRLGQRLEGRARLQRRDWLSAVLPDVGAGSCSVLEHGYLYRVERAHGLPAAGRQVRDRVGDGWIYRDVEYEVGLVVELDGRLHHDSARGRDRDMDRDLVTATSGRSTVRISYGQVFDRPCWTAQRIATLLTTHGWGGVAKRCPGCF
jgi:hypothetical protein